MRAVKILACGVIIALGMMLVASSAVNYTEQINNSSTTAQTQKRLAWAVWDDPDDLDMQPNADIVIVKDGTENKGYGYGTIFGRILNRTGKRLSYLQISFSLYSEGGAKVGSCFDNISGLDSGETWSFQAYCSNYYGNGTYKIDSVSYW